MFGLFKSKKDKDIEKVIKYIDMAMTFKTQGEALYQKLNRSEFVLHEKQHLSILAGVVAGTCMFCNMTRTVSLSEDESLKVFNIYLQKYSDGSAIFAKSMAAINTTEGNFWMCKAIDHTIQALQNKEPYLIFMDLSELYYKIGTQDDPFEKEGMKFVEEQKRAKQWLD